QISIREIKFAAQSKKILARTTRASCSLATCTQSHVSKCANCLLSAGCPPTKTMRVSTIPQRCSRSRRHQGSGFVKTNFPWPRRKTGVQGHLQFATPELGKIYNDMKVDLAVKQIRSLLVSGR